MKKIKNFYVVGIGASAGGLQALQEFFQNIPPKPDMAFIVVTHLLRNHKSILSRILSGFTTMKVIRMKGCDLIEPNCVYVLPENAKVQVKDGVLLLRPRGEEEIVNKIIDEFFHSLAKDQGDKAVAIIFSGMGSDGSAGVQTIHESGGIVLVQEPHSTAFKGMPDSVIQRDHPDKILPPAELAATLSKTVSEKKHNVEH